MGTVRKMTPGQAKELAVVMAQAGLTELTFEQARALITGPRKSALIDAVRRIQQRFANMSVWPPDSMPDETRETTTEDDEESDKPAFVLKFVDSRRSPRPSAASDDLPDTDADDASAMPKMPLLHKDFRFEFPIITADGTEHRFAAVGFLDRDKFLLPIADACRLAGNYIKSAEDWELIRDHSEQIPKWMLKWFSWLITGVPFIGYPGCVHCFYEGLRIAWIEGFGGGLGFCDNRVLVLCRC